jgi:hypothetical protein
MKTLVISLVVVGVCGCYDKGVSSTADADLPDTGSSAQDAGGDAAPDANDGEFACAIDSDCMQCAYPTAPQSEDDCYCTVCANTPVSRDECLFNAAAYKTHCSGIAEVCPATVCILPPPTACTAGECEVQTATTCEQADCHSSEYCQVTFGPVDNPLIQCTLHPDDCLGCEQCGFNDCECKEQDERVTEAVCGGA